jgi:DNA polymerase III delta prime subunit
MKHITGLIGREDLLKEVLTEIRKGKHVLLSEPVGVGKSALLEEAARALERRQADQKQLGLFDDADVEEAPPAYTGQERRRSRKCVLIYLHEHTGKAQFVAIARRLLQTGLLKPSTLDLARSLDALPPDALEWTQIRRSVNRLSMKDLADGIIPALHAFRKDTHGTVILCVDDMTRLTPTQQAFWLAVYAHAQIVGCASCGGR